MSDDNVYFAAAEPEVCANDLLGRARSFFSAMESNAYLTKIYRMWKAYHGIYSDNPYDDHQVSFTGEQGEFTSLPINHFRNIGEHMLTMITSNRPVLDARPINSDYKSQAQTSLAVGILEYYMREKGLEDAIHNATKMAIVLGSGYVKLEWNASAGEEFDVDDETGEMAYNGDIEFSNLSPLDVVFDGTKESWNHEWLLVRKYENKYNLAAKYPEYADRIKGLKTKSDENRYSIDMWSNDKSDDVAVYEFFHKKSAAVPDGRYLLFLDSDMVLMDIDLPYRRIPVFRIVPSEILGTSYGYSPMFDVFPIQQCLNSINSAIMTNQNAFGVHNIYVPRNANLNINNLAGGLNIIEGDAMPQVLQLLSTPEEMFKFQDMLVQAAETISGVNSVARGNPEASLRSAQSLALVQSMALQFISGFQKGYVKLIEDVGSGLIDILKDFAHTPRLVAIVGKNKQSLLREFTGEEVNNVSRVIVDVGNALSRTVAGRVEMADQMLQMKMFKTPQQYFQVLETGRLDVMFEGDLMELMLIKKENEFLLDGKEVLAQIYDAHKTHIMEHKSIASDPEVRLQPELMARLNEHIQEHIDMLRTVDPDTLILINEEPLQPMPQPMDPNAPQEPTGPGEAGGMQDVLQQEAGSIQPGENVGNTSNPGGIVPSLPNPPPPFENKPVLAGEGE